MSELGRAISKLQRVSYWEGYMAAVNQAQQAMYAGDIYAWLIKVTSGEIVEGELVVPEQETAP